MIVIQPMIEREVPAVAQLALKLWPDAHLSELAAEILAALSSGKDLIYVAKANESIIAFAHVALHLEYVEGTSTSPVGYLEGIFVEEAYRKQGIALQLVQHCESWAKGKGCQEFASDAELPNVDSQRFHEKVGFKEVNRVVCYVKELA